MEGCIVANSWLRLWHDMPNDPKWRTIARVSKQTIPSVMAVYLHILVSASNATERGRTQNVCNEDIASALDLDCEQVDQIINAMQGRVLDGDKVSGWAKRQVEREDGAAERAKAWREAKKQAKTSDSNATERSRTQDERKQTPDTDTDTDTDKKEEPTGSLSPVPEKQKTEQPGFSEFWKAWPTTERKQGKAKCADIWKKSRLEPVAPAIVGHVEKMKASRDWQKNGGEFVPMPATYLNAKRWDGAEADMAEPEQKWAGAV